MMLSALLDFLAPRRCAMCRQRLACDEVFLCATCWQQLPRTSFAAAPFRNMMVPLFMGIPFFNRAAAWLFYASHNRSAGLLHMAKYHHRRDICLWLGTMAAREFADKGFFDDIDCLLPVPLTRRRRRQRGYNQSEVLAKGIQSVTALPIVADAVVRVHFRESQTRLRGAARRKNVADAFRVVRPKKLRGKHILLVDDVCTTGSTLTACANALAPVEDATLSFMTIFFTYS